MATLKQFLRTGELGPIHFGMSQAEVINVLGQPQDESVARQPKILKYGGLELTFAQTPEEQDPILIHIGLYYAPCAELIPEPARTTDFPGDCTSTVDDVREFLTQAGIDATNEVEEDASYLILPSGARITFDGQNLKSINFAKRAPTPAKKQISISIPADVLKQFRILARQMNRSVSDLGAEWITQRINELQADNVVGARKDT